jgi:hypothetical protein
MYYAWSQEKTADKTPVPIWQLAVLGLTLSVGFITYGYNIMKGEFPKQLILCNQIANNLHSHG